MAFYSFPALSGTPAGVKIAFHNFGPHCTPETIDRQVRESEVARIRAWMAERVPGLALGREVIDPWLPIAYSRLPSHPN